MPAGLTRDRIPALLVGTLGLAAVVTYYRQVWPSAPAFVESIDHCGSLFCDFVNHYYRMGRQVFVSPFPVDGFFYSAFFALLLRPFGRAPLETALWYWGVVQVVTSVALLVVPAGRMLRSPAMTVSFYVLAFATSIPVLHNFKWGQVSVIVSLAVVAAFWAAERGWREAAGLLLGWAAAVKYYPVIFAWHFLVRRDWRTLRWFVGAVIVFFVLIPVVVLGPKWTWEFQKESAAMVKVDAEYVARNANSQYFAYVMRRLTGVARDSGWVTAFVIAGYGIAAANAWLLWRRRRDGRTRTSALSMAVLFATLPFLTTTSWPHYFVYLPFCQIVAGVEAAGRPGWRGRAWVLGGVCLSALLSSVFVFRLYPDWKTYLNVPFVFLSNATLLLCLWGLMASSSGCEPEAQHYADTGAK